MNAGVLRFLLGLGQARLCPECLRWVVRERDGGERVFASEEAHACE